MFQDIDDTVPEITNTTETTDEKELLDDNKDEKMDEGQDPEVQNKSIPSRKNFLAV